MSYQDCHHLPAAARLLHQDQRISQNLSVSPKQKSGAMTTRSAKHACGKPMQTNPDKQASESRGSAHTEDETDKIQRKAFRIGDSPSQLIQRTWRRMCPHIPLRERSQIRKVMLQKWRHQKRKHSIYSHFSQRPKLPHMPENQNYDGFLADDAMRDLFHEQKSLVGDLIAADHKVLNEGSEPRNNHRYAVVVQDLATQWIKSYPCQTKNLQETEKSLRKFVEPSQKAKSY